MTMMVMTMTMMTVTTMMTMIDDTDGDNHDDDNGDDDAFLHVHPPLCPSARPTSPRCRRGQCCILVNAP